MNRLCRSIWLREIKKKLLSFHFGTVWHWVTLISKFLPPRGQSSKPIRLPSPLLPIFQAFDGNSKSYSTEKSALWPSVTPKPDHENQYWLLDAVPSGQKVFWTVPWLGSRLGTLSVAFYWIVNRGVTSTQGLT